MCFIFHNFLEGFSRFRPYVVKITRDVEFLKILFDCFRPVTSARLVPLSYEELVKHFICISGEQVMEIINSASLHYNSDWENPKLQVKRFLRGGNWDL